MTLVLKRFNTSDGGKQPAIADQNGDVAETLVVFSETDVDGLTPGQFTFKHNVARGTEPGTWTD